MVEKKSAFKKMAEQAFDGILKAEGYLPSRLSFL